MAFLLLAKRTSFLYKEAKSFKKKIMNTDLKLFVALIGGKQPDDRIEAHNLFIGVSTDIMLLAPDIKKAWSGAGHIDAYMVLDHVDAYDISLIPVEEGTPSSQHPTLLLVNIGYYLKGQFTEFHKLIPLVLEYRETVVSRVSKDLDFQKGLVLGTARPHIDDKHVIETTPDIDDVIAVAEEVKRYRIILTKTKNVYTPDPIVGYFKLPKQEEEKSFPWYTLLGFILIFLGAFGLWYAFRYPKNIDENAHFEIWLNTAIAIVVIVRGVQYLKKKK